MGRYNDGWPRYVPVAERRRRAAKAVDRMKKKGRQVSPIEIAGRKIARTFWGDAWCKNLESYSDYSNRLPRGRTYARNGSVIDLTIQAGNVQALVYGSKLYTVDIRVEPLSKGEWTEIKKQCAGQIDSLVELLQGSISESVMEAVSRKGEGLFPSPQEIQLDCSCPDWADMCKHVAAALYGVGARLDQQPELLFTLRGVDPTELVETAIDQAPAAGRKGKGRKLATSDLSSVFGVDIDSARTTAPTTGSSEIPTDSAETVDRVLEIISRSPNGASRSEVQAATGLTDARWYRTIRQLLASDDVHRTGSKRGTRYHVGAVPCR